MYVWNMRELSSVVRGLTRAEPTTIVDIQTMIRLWAHETNRVFCDRMINMKEDEAFKKLQADIAVKYFNDICNVEEAVAVEDQIFTTFYGNKDMHYNLIPEAEGLNKILVEKLDEYNESFTIMDLVLFKEAIQHICRITRVIENPGGNMMLVGVGGSGKQSLSRLSGFILGMTIEQLAT